MARGKLVDKCRNLLYKGSDKAYVRKRKSSSDNDNTDSSVENDEGAFYLYSPDRKPAPYGKKIVYYFEFILI